MNIDELLSKDFDRPLSMDFVVVGNTAIKYERENAGGPLINGAKQQRVKIKEYVPKHRRMDVYKELSKLFPICGEIEYTSK